MSQIIILHLWVCLTSLYFPVQRFFAAFVILPFREKPSYKTMECVTLLLCKSCSKCSTGGRNCSISPNPYGGYCHPLPSHQTKPCALVDCWIYTRKRKRASVLFELFAYLCISWLSESVFCWVGKNEQQKADVENPIPARFWTKHIPANCEGRRRSGNSWKSCDDVVA